MDNPTIEMQTILIEMRRECNLTILRKLKYNIYGNLKTIYKSMFTLKLKLTVQLESYSPIQIGSNTNHFLTINSNLTTRVNKMIHNDLNFMNTSKFTR